MTDAFRSAAPARSFPRINLPLAALLGGAAAFAAFAMPTYVFSGLVEWSGLPLIIDAAEPPLGATARFAFVAVAGIVAFAVGWIILAAVDRAEARRARRQASRVAARHAPPRIRRADAHPDAPSRRPIFAEQDFGAVTIIPAARPEPEPESEPETAPEAARPFPAFLSPDQSEAEPSPDDTLVLGAEHFAPAEAEDISEPQPIEEAEDTPEYHAAEEAEETPEPQQAEEAVAAPEDLPHAAPEQQPDPAPASISSLMERLEGGLQSRSRHAPATPRPAKAFGKQGLSPDGGHRLRSALTDLQKLAGRPNG